MELCFTSTLGAKSLQVTAWEVSTGVIQRVYSCDTGLQEESKNNEGFSCLCLLGHSHVLCTSPTLPFIYVWNLNKGQVHMKIACGGIVLALACSPNGTYGAGAIGEKIHLWEVSTGRLLAVMSLHYQPVKVLKFSDDGVHLISGGDDSRVVVWRVASVLSDAFDSSGHCLPYNNVSPALFSRESTLTRHVWSDHSQPVTDIHCGSGGLKCRVLTASLDQTCKMYELSSGSLLCSILFDFGLTTVTMDLDEHFLFVGGFSGQISQVNLFTHNTVKLHGLGHDSTQKSQYIGHNKPITGLAVTVWDRQLVSTSMEDTARVWDIASHQTLKTVKLKGPVSALMLCGQEVDVSSNKTRGSREGPSVQHIQPFKKQLHYKSLSKNSDGAIPVHIHGAMDPLCDLESLEELECCYSFPTVSEHSSEGLAGLKLKQELSEIKEVNKKLYSFMVDELFDSATSDVTGES